MEMAKGKITSWHERIIVPGVSFEPYLKGVGEGDGGGFTPDIDIDIQRVA